MVLLLIKPKKAAAVVQLCNFVEAEIINVFREICKKSDEADETKSSDLMTQDKVFSYLQRRLEALEIENGLKSNYDTEMTSNLRREFAAVEAKRFIKFFEEQGSGGLLLTEVKFYSMIKKSASSLDFKRTWPLTLSMLLVGSSVGVVAPAMPFVRNNLGLTAAEYGMVVSAFALAKMSGNIPSAVLVERHGRKVR